MRPTGLLLLAASPVLCAVQPRTVAQVPVLVGNKNVATSSYPQDSAVNGTIGMSHTVSLSTRRAPFLGALSIGWGTLELISFMSSPYCQELDS